MTDDTESSSDEKRWSDQLFRNGYYQRFTSWRLVFVYPSFFLLSPLFDSTAIPPFGQPHPQVTEMLSDEIESGKDVFFIDRPFSSSLNDLAG